MAEWYICLPPWTLWVQRGKESDPQKGQNFLPAWENLGPLGPKDFPANWLGFPCHCLVPNFLLRPLWGLAVCYHPVFYSGQGPLLGGSWALGWAPAPPMLALPFPLRMQQHQQQQDHLNLFLVCLAGSAWTGHTPQASAS